MKTLNAFNYQNHLSPENGSGMHRKWTGFRSARPLAILAIFLMLFVAGIGNAWGTTYTTGTTFPTTGWSKSGSTVTRNDVTWTYSSSTYIGSEGTNIQVGSKNNPQTDEWTFQTPISSFGSGKKVTSITLRAYVTQSTANYDISAGGGSVKSGSLSTSASDYTASSLNITSGSIVITMQGVGNCRAMYLCSVTVVYENAASCSTDPTVGTASLNGSFNLSTVGVQCASITPGTNCSVASGDYGFIWYERDGTKKEIGGSGVTKVAVTSGAYSSGSFSANLTKSSFELGTRYSVRAFATNGKPATVYSDTITFQPRSVTFNLNGHGSSAPSTQYVNNGGKATDPSYSESVTGWTFGGWYKEAGCSNAWTFGTDVVSGGNKTLYAKWTAKTTTVSFNQNSGTGGQTSDKTATYGSAMPTPITCPTRTGYDFGGYYDGTGGTGTQYYTNTGASARNWDKEAATATLYAKWTAKSFDVTWMVNGVAYTTGDPSGSVDFGTHVAKLPTAPTPPCGDKFMGWTTTNMGSALGQSAPGVLFTTADGAPTISAEGAVTYYAVFADYDE